MSTNEANPIPSLTLHRLTVEDVCTGGGWSFASDNEYKSSCTLNVTPYYSIQGDVLDEILTADDRLGSPNTPRPTRSTSPARYSARTSL